MHLKIYTTLIMCFILSYVVRLLANLLLIYHLNLFHYSLASRSCMLICSRFPAVDNLHGARITETVTVSVMDYTWYDLRPGHGFGLDRWADTYKHDNKRDHVRGTLNYAIRQREILKDFSPKLLLFENRPKRDQKLNCSTFGALQKFRKSEK